MMNSLVIVRNSSYRKVMFSQVSVCPQGGVHGERGCVWQRGACMVKRGMQGKEEVMHGRGACVAGEMATAANGMHPTGMHSCFILFEL